MDIPLVLFISSCPNMPNATTAQPGVIIRRPTAAYGSDLEGEEEMEGGGEEEEEEEWRMGVEGEEDEGEGPRRDCSVIFQS